LALRPKPHVVSRQKFNKNNFYLTASEKAPRAGIPAIAEINVVRVRSDELVVVFFALQIAKIAVPERVKFIKWGLRLFSEDAVGWNRGGWVERVTETYYCVVGKIMTS
jgi:hypothetical protein